jgi:hypothetical protein
MARQVLEMMGVPATSAAVLAVWSKGKELNNDMNALAAWAFESAEQLLTGAFDGARVAAGKRCELDCAGDTHVSFAEGGAGGVWGCHHG